MRIDSHQHFWRFSPAEYPWIQPEWSIRRDFLPADFAGVLGEHGLDGSVAVQARQSLEESRWLLELADQTSWIKGVVGWVDLCSAKVEAQLETFAAHPKFVGVRHVVQDEPDEGFLLREDFRRGLGKLRGFGLTYELLVYPKQLPAAIELVRAFPEQPFVLDHLAKPLIRDGVLSPWREHIRQLAESPNVLCKLSGMVTEARWRTWQQEDFRPYLDVALEAFGPGRLLYGSDWPVALLSAEYRQVYDLLQNYVAGLGNDAAARIFGLNAVGFYDL